MAKQTQLFKIKRTLFSSEIKRLFETEVDNVVILCNTKDLTIGGSISNNMVIRIVFKKNVENLTYKKSDKYIMLPIKEFKEKLVGLDGNFIEFFYKVENNNQIVTIKSGKVTHKVTIKENAGYEAIQNGIISVIPKISSEENLESYFGCSVDSFKIVKTMVNGLSYSDSIFLESAKDNMNVYIKPIKGGTNESLIEVPITATDGDNAACKVHKLYVKGFSIFDGFDLYIHNESPVYATTEDENVIKDLVIATRDESDDNEDDVEEPTENELDDYENKLEDESFDISE